MRRIQKAIISGKTIEEKEAAVKEYVDFVTKTKTLSDKEFYETYIKGNKLSNDALYIKGTKRDKNLKLKNALEAKRKEILDQEDRIARFEKQGKNTDYLVKDLKRMRDEYVKLGSAYLSSNVDGVLGKTKNIDTSKLDEPKSVSEIAKDTRTKVNKSSIKHEDVKDGSSKVLKGNAKIIGYIIRKVESNNNYTKTGKFNGENFISYGAYHFTEASGSMHKSLVMLSGMNPTYKEELLQYISKFKNGYYRGHPSEIIAFCKRIGTDKTCKESQDKTFLALYYNPAYREYKKLKLEKDNPLLLLHMVDHYHNRGNIKGFVVYYKQTHDIIASRIASYKHASNWNKYGKGWTDRIAKVDRLGRKYFKAGDIPDDEIYTPSDDNLDTARNTDGTKSGSWYENAIKEGIKSILEFFGVETDTIDSITSDNVHIPNKDNAVVTSGDKDNPMDKNSASSLNPIINDWATEQRYNSLNNEAKTFFSKFSHYAMSKGIKLRIPPYGGNRAIENQKHLYSIGRNGNPGKPVTWTLKSYHIGGRAIDIISNKGYKAVKENHQIAVMMRTFAQENPELGAAFLNMNKDPNHVQFPKSNKIKEINVEELIKNGGKHSDKEIEAKYAQNAIKNPVKGLNFTGEVNVKSIDDVLNSTTPKPDINNTGYDNIDAGVFNKSDAGNGTTDVNVTNNQTVKNAGVNSKQSGIQDVLSKHLDAIKTSIPKDIKTEVTVNDETSKDRLNKLTDINDALHQLVELNSKLIEAVASTNKGGVTSQGLPRPIIDTKR
jgi:hypothetical protein